MDRRLVEGATVFERLAADGYETGVFTENPWLTDHPAGFGRAFGTVVSAAAAEDATGDDPHRQYVHSDHPGVAPDGYWFARRFLEWVDRQSGPWAACLNLMDAHFPYNVRPDHDAFGGPVAWSAHDSLPRRWEWSVHAGDYSRGLPRLLESLYESAVRQADAVLEGVWSELEARGVAAETLLVATSDHGECFGAPPPQAGEPLALEHGLGTHEDLFHVPLVVNAPGQTAARRVDSLAALDRFPAAVAAARDGETVDTGWFAADRATAHQPPLHPRVLDRARATCPDPGRFEHAATLLYEDGADGGVAKRAAFGPHAYATTAGKTRRSTTSGSLEPGPTPDGETTAVEADPVLEAAADCAVGSLAGMDLPVPLTEPLDGGTDLSVLDPDGVGETEVGERLRDLGYL
jgi:hypothetical protein